MNADSHPTQRHVRVLVALVVAASVWPVAWVLLAPSAALFGTLAWIVLAFVVRASSLTNMNQQREHR